MRVLSEVAYITKSRGPRTEPKKNVQRGEVVIAFHTTTARGQFRAVP